jgi:selenocysteine lyase/cysteine desulfurase
MMAPRGTGFCYLAPALRERIRPLAAGWFAGDHASGSYYGLPMRLSPDARAFDLSPAWHPWVGTDPALEVIERVGVDAIYHHNVALANRFLTGLGQPPSNSAIVTVNVPGAEAKLAAAGIRAAVRKGVVRASFHVYTTTSDVDAALNALA